METYIIRGNELKYKKEEILDSVKSIIEFDKYFKDNQEVIEFLDSFVSSIRAVNSNHDCPSVKVTISDSSVIIAGKEEYEINPSRLGEVYKVISGVNPGTFLATKYGYVPIYNDSQYKCDDIFMDSVQYKARTKDLVCKGYYASGVKTSDSFINFNFEDFTQVFTLGGVMKYYACDYYPNNKVDVNIDELTKNISDGVKRTIKYSKPDRSFWLRRESLSTARCAMVDKINGYESELTVPLDERNVRVMSVTAAYRNAGRKDMYIPQSTPEQIISMINWACGGNPKTRSDLEKLPNRRGPYSSACDDYFKHVEYRRPSQKRF